MDINRIIKAAVATATATVFIIFFIWIKSK
jgi:hypothetical protein